MFKSSITNASNSIRRRLIELGYRAGKNGAHFGSSLSLVEILVALYELPQSNSKDIGSNRIILSKGHGALGLFCALEYYGYILKEDLDHFNTDGTEFFSHAKKDLSRGIEFSGGSLGLGLSYGVGLSVALERKKSASRVYVIVGDGELDEGICWESIMLAAHLSLSNLTLLIDNNQMQSDGEKSTILKSHSFADKLFAFGFDVSEVNGHDVAALSLALTRNTNKPHCVIANTVKGKGISFMESQASWHYGVLREPDYQLAMEELL